MSLILEAVTRRWTLRLLYETQKKRLASDSLNWTLRLHGEQTDYESTGLRYNNRSFANHDRFPTCTSVGALVGFE